MQSNSGRGLTDRLNDLSHSDRTTGTHTTGSSSSATGHGHNVGSYPNASLPGPAPNTAGPHNKDILNKIDPTVDALSGGTQVLGPGINSGPAQSSHAGQAPVGATPHATNTHAGHAQPGSTIHSSNTHGQPMTEAGYANKHGAPLTEPYNTGTGNNTVHNSNLANKMDPRVDTSGPGAGPNTMGTTTGHHTTGTHGTHGTGTHMGNNNPYSENAYARETEFGSGGQHHAYGNESRLGGGPTNTYDSRGTTGPHSSNMANKMDPRVDSTSTSQASYGTSQSGSHRGLTGTGTHPQENVYDQPGYTGGNTGTMHRQEVGHDASSRKPVHSSGLANKMDPRVDSSTYPQEGNYTTSSGMGGTQGTHTSGPGHMTTGTTGTHIPSHTYENTTASRMEPGVGGGLGHNAPYETTGHSTMQPGHEGRMRGTTEGHHQTATTTHHGPEIHPGPASKTAGPHKSNLLNKLDPSVDSKATVSQQREYRTS